MKYLGSNSIDYTLLYILLLDNILSRRLMHYIKISGLKFNFHRDDIHSTLSVSICEFVYGFG